MLWNKLNVFRGSVFKFTGAGVVYPLLNRVTEKAWQDQGQGIVSNLSAAISKCFLF